MMDLVFLDRGDSRRGRDRRRNRFVPRGVLKAGKKGRKPLLTFMVAALVLMDGI